MPQTINVYPDIDLTTILTVEAIPFRVRDRYNDPSHGLRYIDINTGKVYWHDTLCYTGSTLSGLPVTAEKVNKFYGNKLIEWNNKPFNSRTELSEDEVLNKMIERGGGFAAALALAWKKADLDNRNRLRTAFAELYASYAKDE